MLLDFVLSFYVKVGVVVVVSPKDRGIPGPPKVSLGQPRIQRTPKGARDPEDPQEIAWGTLGSRGNHWTSARPPRESLGNWGPPQSILGAI